MTSTTDDKKAPVPISGVQIPRLTPRRRQAPSSNPTPIPPTPPLPPPPPRPFKFTHPTRRILSSHDHEIFINSSSYTLIISFVFGLSDAVKDTPVSAVKVDELRPAVQCVLHILDEVEKVVERSPPVDEGGSRFGNKGFRDFIDAIKEEHEGWHRQLGIEDPAAIDEVSTYFLQAFGNRMRIDYGSGHELNFIIWLYVKSLQKVLAAVTNFHSSGYAFTNSTLYKNQISRLWSFMCS
jgi:serine/threonine-protein phosphatase 2A activator